MNPEAKSPNRSMNPKTARREQVVRVTKTPLRLMDKILHDPKDPKLGIMVYSLLWVMQDFVHQPYDSTLAVLVAEHARDCGVRCWLKRSLLCSTGAPTSPLTPVPNTQNIPTPLNPKPERHKPELQRDGSRRGCRLSLGCLNSSPQMRLSTLQSKRGPEKKKHKRPKP